MATYTSYLNLEKPTTSETFNLLKMNQNWDKIDAGVSALNSNLNKYINHETLNLQSSELNSDVTWTVAYIRKVGRIAEIYMEGKSNVLISSWSQLCTGLAPYGAKWMPYQTNNAYSITIGQSTVMCNMNQDMVINTPTEIPANTNIRFRTIYLTQVI